MRLLNPRAGAQSSGKQRLRIEKGRYPITTQFGKYVSIGYSTDTEVAAQPHMPAVALADTGARTGILIHPGHPGDEPFAFISSIGCFNLTKALEPADDIEYFESRACDRADRQSCGVRPGRVPQCPGQTDQAEYAGSRAFAVVDGEPTNFLAPEEPVIGGNPSGLDRDSMGTG